MAEGLSRGSGGSSFGSDGAASSGPWPGRVGGLDRGLAGSGRGGTGGWVWSGPELMASALCGTAALRPSGLTRSWPFRSWPFLTQPRRLWARTNAQAGRGRGGAMPHCCGSKRPLPACRPWVSRYAEARSSAAAVIAAGWLGGAMLTSASERLSRAQQHASAAAPGTARSASLFPSSCQGASVPITLNEYPGQSYISSRRRWRQVTLRCTRESDCNRKPCST